MDASINEITIEQVRTEAVATQQAQEAAELVQIIVFKLGTQEYALPIEDVKEIVITPGIAKMPQTPNYVKGVANIRGTIIAMLDLEEKFSISQNESDQNKFNFTLVIASDNFKVGILVRSVPNTFTIEKNQIDQSGSVMQYSFLDDKCIQGIIKSDNRLIVLLDIMQLMELMEVETLNL